MHLYEKQINFSGFFFSIFRIYIKFWTFSKKDDPDSWFSLNDSTFTIFIDHCEGNSLTPDDKFSLFSRDNLMEQIQSHLSQKQKTFSCFFFWIF